MVQLNNVLVVIAFLLMIDSSAHHILAADQAAVTTDSSSDNAEQESTQLSPSQVSNPDSELMATQIEERVAQLPLPQVIGDGTVPVPPAASGLPVTPNSPVATPPLGANFAPPVGAVPNFSTPGSLSQVGATRGSRSSAPNMIGDLFNGGSSSLLLNSTTRTRVNFSTPLIFTPGSGQLVNAADITATLSSPEGIPGILEPGTSYSVDQYSFATSPFNVEGVGPVSNNSVQAVAPVSNGPIFTDVNSALRLELPDLIGNANAEDFLDISYDQGESTLNLNGANNRILSATYVYNVSTKLPVPSPGEVVGRYSIAENNSPIPRDRIFLDYNFFYRARISAVPTPVNRWAPGFEKTLFGGQSSFELRMPMAVTLSSDIDFAKGDLAKYEFGDINLSFKTLLWESERTILSAGLGLSLPTADDFILRDTESQPVIQVENQSFHLLPFVAALYQPNERWFFQHFGQIDVDTNGNPVLINGLFQTGGFALESEGRLRSQTLLRISSSAGAFVFRRPEQNFSALALALEAHYSSTLDRSVSVGNEFISAGDPDRSLNVLNLTSGMHAFVGSSVITAAYGVPVTPDRFFDGELRVFFNRYF